MYWEIMLVYEFDTSRKKWTFLLSVVRAARLREVLCRIASPRHPSSIPLVSAKPRFFCLSRRKCNCTEHCGIVVDVMSCYHQLTAWHDKFWLAATRRNAHWCTSNSSYCYLAQDSVFSFYKKRERRDNAKSENCILNIYSFRETKVMNIFLQYLWAEKQF